MRKGLLAAAVILVVVAGVVLSPAGRGFIAEKRALKNGADAYLFGYPLVTMQATREALTRPPAAPDTFIHTRFLPDSVNTVDVVRPSRDVLYSSAWVRLGDRAVIVGQPATRGRFWLLSMLDSWTDVFGSVGSRSVGDRSHRFLVAGPDYRGRTPPDMEFYRSPTASAWLLVRVAVAGPGDVREAAEVQQGFTLTRVAEDGTVARRPQQPVVIREPAVRDTSVRARVDGMDASEFFTTLSAAMAGQQAHQGDEPMLDTLAGLGVTPGRPFDLSAQSPPVQRGLQEAVGRVQNGMTQAFAEGKGSTVVNGWRVPPMILGAYGTEYATRAVVAREGLGANRPEEAVYASTGVDSEGRPLEAAQTYRIRMPAEVPARAYWSLTVYDDDGSLPAVPDDRLSVTSLQDPPANPDGSVDVVVSSDDPGPGVVWLQPPSTGPFTLTMRLYWPEHPVVANAWEYPPVERQ